jgi:hypothetical protein
MPHTHVNRSTPAAAGVLILLMACLGLTACGGSSTSSSTNASASAAASGPPGSGSGRFNARRECLQKNGITLPRRPPGRGAPSRGGFLGGGVGPQLPKGVTRAQFQAALRKCGAGGGFFGATGRLNTPSTTKALAKFATCLRHNGVSVPEPNTSGRGPIFNTSGLNPSSARFKAATAKCRTDLPGRFGTGAGG